jgi:hypothetical protein
VYDAVSEFVRPTDQNLADLYNGYANGAGVASAMAASFAIKPKLAWQFANNSRETQTQYWRLQAREELSQEIKIELKTCAELNPLQTELVEQARRQAYGFE